jgi:hypothetical protein
MQPASTLTEQRFLKPAENIEGHYLTRNVSSLILCSLDTTWQEEVAWQDKDFLGEAYLLSPLRILVLPLSEATIG